MQRYFINEEDFLNKRINEVHHIKNVMRMNIGDDIIVVFKKAYMVRISDISDYVYFNVLYEIEENKELDIDVTIIQGYPKGDKTEDILMHNTELGASSFIVTFMKRSIVKLDDKKISQKLERYKKIVKEASEQSHRLSVPDVKIDFLKRIDYSKFDLIIVAYEANKDYNILRDSINSLKSSSRVAIVIGPEGGIDEEEIVFLKSKNAIFCSLGKRILRTENAANFLMSIFTYEREL